MEPKKPGDSEERRNSHSGGDDNDGDFDLSGFASDDASSAPKAEKPIKQVYEEPPRGKKVVGKAPRFQSRNTLPGGDRPPRDGGKASEGPAGQSPGAGKPGYPPRKGPAGPRGGWEKLPQREHFRGKDQGYVPRGPRAATGPRSDRGGPVGKGSAGGRNDGPAGAGGRYGDRGDSRDSRDPTRGPRDFNAPRTPAGQGYVAPRSFPPRNHTPREIERVAGAHKPVSAEIKPFLPLKTDKGRWKESQFFLEGAKNIADALSVSPAIIQTVFLAPEFDDKDLLTVLKKNRIQVIPVTMEDIKNLADTETPQGILAVANFATLRPDYALARYVTLLDAVQDPGNVGAILRTSLALGMDAVVFGKGTCDPYNPKVVRSSASALLRMPFETGEDLGAKMEFLRLKGFSIVATSSHAPITLDKAKLRKKVALIMGNEGAGTGATYLDMADAVVKIPLKNKVESLNVGVAHGILSYQLIHGRT
ncbi:MAG: TrmH family RNA methyltransferase [Fibrobacteria bacterium]